MRSLQIIIAGIWVASLGVGLVLLPGILPWRPGTVRLLFAYWPAMLVVWLSLYGIVVLVLRAALAFAEIRGGANGSDGRVWVRHCFAGLAAAQYFTSIIALLALGLTRFQVDVPAIIFLPASITSAPALAAAGVVISVGLLGWLCLTAVDLLHRPATSLPVVESPELELLCEIRELVRSQRRRPAADSVELVQSVKRGQLSIMEAVKDLATAVDRARSRLDEIKAPIQDRVSRQPAETGAGSTDVQAMVTELRDAIAALQASVTRLSEISAHETPLVRASDAQPAAAEPRSQLSSELRALLHEMAPSTVSSLSRG